MIVIPYKPSHLESLLLQPAQAPARTYFENPDYARALDRPGNSFTAMDGDRVLAIAGVVPLWEGRAEAWALLGSDLKRDFIGIHRATLRFLDVCGFRRVEAAVDAQFCQAVDWVKLLGFECEGPLKAYTPDGRDCIRYARVRGK